MEGYVEYNDEEQKPEIIHVPVDDDYNKETEVSGKDEISNKHDEHKEEERKPEVIEIIDSDDDTEEIKMKEEGVYS